MTGTREQRVDAYMLREKLRSRVSERGADISGISATSTSELKRRAEMGRNPRENCAQDAFDESYRRKTAERAAGVPLDSRSRPQQARDGVRNQSGARPQQSREPQTQRSGAANSQRTQTSQRAQTGRSRVGEAEKAAAARAKAKRQEGALKITPDTALKAKKRPFPIKILSTVVICTMLVLVMVFEYAEVYASSNRNDSYVSGIENKKSEGRELEVLIENKHDMKYVEQYATSTLGMIKEDSLQRKYISLSDGERIDTIETEDDSEEGVMLSSFLAALTGFLERFK